MSALGIAALALPLLPASLVVLALRAKRTLDAFAPLQFAMLIAGVVLAVNIKQPQAQTGPAVMVLVAIAGLFVAVLRKDSLARRAVYSFDWEKFERDLHFWSIVADLR